MYPVSKYVLWIAFSLKVQKSEINIPQGTKADLYYTSQQKAKLRSNKQMFLNHAYIQQNVTCGLYSTQVSRSLKMAAMNSGA